MPAEAEPLWFIPRAVRDKLDRIAVKLHLREWQGLTLVQRQRLCDQPCESASETAQFGSLLRQLLGRDPETLAPKPQASGRDDG